MQKVILSIHDKVANTYSDVFCVATVGVAFRDLAREVVNTDSILCKNPGDFELCRLASFDTDEGTVVAESIPVVVCQLTDLLPKEKNSVS